MTLPEFLLARIAEREAIARAAGGEEWWAVEIPTSPKMRRLANEPTKIIIDSPRTLIAYEATSEQAAEHITHHNPAHVLADCERDRQIVHQVANAEMAASQHDSTEADRAVSDALFGTLLLLALPDADHPDYRAEWKP